MTRKMKLAVGAGVLVVIGVLVILLLPKPAKKVSTALVARKNIDLTVSASGKVAAGDKTNVGSTMAGRVGDILVEEGQAVPHGEPLIEVQAEDLAIAVKQARVNVSIAELNDENASDAVEIAENNLNKLRAGATPQQLAVSAAGLSQFAEGVQAAERGVSDIRQLNRRGLQQAKNGVVKAEKAFAAAAVAVDDALAQWNAAQVAVPPLTAVQVLAYEAAYHQAQGAYRSAKAALEGARFALASTRALNTQSMHTAQAQLGTARAMYATGKAQYDLTAAPASSYDINTAEEQVQQAQTQEEVADEQVRLAQLSLDTAEVQLGRATIKSPITGIVAEINVNVGEIVTPAPLVPGSPAPIVVIDMDSLRFEASVDEADVTRVRRGEKVSIVLDAYPKRTFQAKVRKVGLTPTPTEGGATAYSAAIKFLRRGISGLREGMNGDAQIVVGTVKKVLVVPATAVTEQAGAAYVFTVSPGRTLEKRQVRLGRVFDHYIEVLSGASPGDRIVRTGLENLQGGEKVTW